MPFVKVHTSKTWSLFAGPMPDEETLRDEAILKAVPHSRSNILVAPNEAQPRAPPSMLLTS